MKEVNTLLIKVILKMPLENQEKELSAQEYLSSVKKNLVFFHPLLVNYIRSVESQMDCLSSIEVLFSYLFRILFVSLWNSAWKYLMYIFTVDLIKMQLSTIHILLVCALFYWGSYLFVFILIWKYFAYILIWLWLWNELNQYWIQTCFWDILGRNLHFFRHY